MPQPLKHPSTRARRNRSSSAATLTATSERRAAPELPARDWHPATVAWWADVWASPMAPEFDSSDIHGMVMLAALVDDFWAAPSAASRKDVASEIRLQSQRFGLSPLDRRRLQWEIERGEEAQDKGRARRAKASDVAPASSRKDPRATLQAV